MRRTLFPSPDEVGPPHKEKQLEHNEIRIKYHDGVRVHMWTAPASSLPASNVKAFLDEVASGLVEYVATWHEVVEKKVKAGDRGAEHWTDVYVDHGPSCPECGAELVHFPRLGTLCCPDQDCDYVRDVKVSA